MARALRSIFGRCRPPPAHRPASVSIGSRQGDDVPPPPPPPVRQSAVPETRQSNGIAGLVRKPVRRGIVDCRTVAIIFTYLRAQSRASRRAGRRRRRARVQIAVATLSGNSLRQTAHTDPASVHQAAKLVAALIRVAGVTASLAESNGSKPGL